jgi:predicted DNA-binding transcriptional regulator YafY
VLAGTFDVPAGFEPAAGVLSALAEMPYRHDVAVRVHGTVDEVRAQLPPAVATVAPLADDDTWVRVRIRAERLDWVPAVLAGLGRRLVVEQPEELRVLVRGLARQLLEAGG